MPSWHEILNDIQTRGGTQDIVRRQYLKALHEQTHRNVIIYYSGWLQKPGAPGMEINDADKNGASRTTRVSPSFNRPSLYSGSCSKAKG